MFTISKDFTFSASHQLTGLPDDHPCARVHGHNFIVRVELTAHDHKLNDVGFVTDYRNLAPIKRYLDETFDHRHLNDVVDFNPTAENMTRFLFERFNASDFLADGEPSFGPVARVGWSETAATWAFFTPDARWPGARGAEALR